MDIFEVLGIPYYKKGSGIHIKKKNRGKFTDYCGGKVTQECIDKAKKSGNSTLKKRAVFAENARAWKHQKGGEVMKRLDIQSLKADPEYKNYDWFIDDKNIEILQDSLENRKARFPQRVSTLAMVIPENGGRTTPHGNGAFGLVGWRGPRAKNLPKDIGGQTHKLMEELFGNPNSIDWTHGGKGTNVNTGSEMHKLYKNTDNTEQATKAIMKGYVRPPQSEYNKRIAFARLLKKHMK